MSCDLILHTNCLNALSFKMIAHVSYATNHLSQDTYLVFMDLHPIMDAYRQNKLLS